MTAADRCLVCAAPLTGRADAQTCSDRCRQALRRARTARAATDAAGVAIDSAPAPAEPSPAVIAVTPDVAVTEDVAVTTAPRLARWVDADPDDDRLDDPLGHWRPV